MKLEISIPFGNKSLDEILLVSSELTQEIEKHGGISTDSGAGFGYRDLFFEIEDYSITDFARKFLVKHGFEDFFCDVVLEEDDE